MTEQTVVNEVTVAPSVLLTVVQHTVLSVAGVAGLATIPGGVNRFLRMGVADGVWLHIQDHTIRVDVHIVLAGDADGSSVAQAIQVQVAQALHDIVGLTVIAVNVIITDVAFAV